MRVDLVKLVTRLFLALSLVFALFLTQGNLCFAADELFQMSVKQVKSGNYKYAMENLGKVIAHNPRDYRAYYFLGFCYEKGGDLKTASNMYARAMVLGYKTRVYDKAATRLQKVNPNAYVAAVSAAQNPASRSRSFPTTVPNSPSRSTSASSSRTSSISTTAASSGESYGNLPPEARIRYHQNPGSPHQLLPASVNGRPITVFFDTGAESCVFGKCHFEQLGLPIPTGKPQTVTRGVGKNGIQATWIVKVTLKVGPIQKENFPIRFVPAYKGEPLLGQTFFADFQYTIDDAGKTILFVRNDRVTSAQSRGSAYSSSSSDRYEVPFTNEGREIIVKVKVNGREIPMFFDTGATPVLLSVKHCGELGIAIPKRVRISRHTGVQGQSLDIAFPVSSISMGPIEHRNFEISVTKQKSLPHPLLGQDFYKNYRYSIDNVNKVIKFTRIR